MEQKIQVGITEEKLKPGQRFRVRRPNGELWVEVPEGAQYGTEIRVKYQGQELCLVLVRPRGAQEPAPTPQAGEPLRPPQEPPAPEAPRQAAPPREAPRPPQEERYRPAPSFGWRGLLIDRLPEAPIFAGTPKFWERVQEELWESVQKKQEFAGVCVFEERPDGVLFYDLERRWAGAFNETQIDFAAGDVLWHSHPTDFLQEANDDFSDVDREESVAAKKPLMLISFGKSSPGYLAQFLLLPNVVTLLANLSIRGVIELERRGTIPPNLLRFGIRAKVYVPRLGEIDILRVEEERPQSLSGAKPVGLDRYTTPVVDTVKGAASGAVEAGKGALNTAQDLFVSGGEAAQSFFKSGKEAAKNLISAETVENVSEKAQNILESGKDAAQSLWKAGKKLFGRDKEKKEDPPDKKKDNLDW